MVKLGNNSVLRTFKFFYPNLAKNLFPNFPKPPNWCSSDFVFVEVIEAAGIDQISGKFLKDGVQILAKHISELWNVSIKLRRSPDTFKIA